jgi:hypothetical protein
LNRLIDFAHTLWGAISAVGVAVVLLGTIGLAVKSFASGFSSEAGKYTFKQLKDRFDPQSGPALETPLILD